MSAKGKVKGVVNGAAKGVDDEIDNFFADDTDSNALNRNELEDLTCKELAKMAQPYSTLSLKSLERKSKTFLCDLILNKGDKVKKDEKPKARATQTKSETENFISTAVSMLNVIKLSRDDEPLNATAQEIFTKQATVYADEKVKADEMDINKASNALFIISAGALLFDGLVGFKNAPTLFKKVKNKFFVQGKKEKAGANDTK